MTTKTCTHEYLAKSRNSTILICRECGVVHLNLQNLSLRLDIQQFSEFASMMALAAKNIKTEAEQNARTPPVLTQLH